MAKKIYINPGHSDKDPGAVGYATERKLNVKTADYMNAYLLANYDCLTKMNPGTMGSLSAIATDANSWGADLFVSIHNNAGGGDGYEALVYSTKNKALGQIFEKHVKAIGQNSRGVKYRPDLGVLRLTHMPAVLNEGAFVDNKKDIQDWDDDAELRVLGEAYAKAAAEFLGMEKKIVAHAPAPAPKPTPAPAPAASAKGMYRVFNAAGKQVGAYSKEANAFDEAKKQLQAGGAVKITLSEK